MRLVLAVLVLLAGCADAGGDGDGSLHARLNGSYTSFGGAVLHR